MYRYVVFCRFCAGSASGTQLALILSDYALQKRRQALFLGALIGFGIGLYDGFFGPGTRTFMILGYTLLMEFDFKTASGNAKIVNLASNFTALTVFMTADAIYLCLLFLPLFAPFVAIGWVLGLLSKAALNLFALCLLRCWF